MSAATGGPRVFVSHASADGKYVKMFVEDILLRGAELRSADVFYSSAADMGVKSGEHLMERVRTETGRSELIVAMVTPMYQTRPVCVAELGAAWARGVLFPVLAPGMNRSELEGVLPGLLIKPADDEGVLDELADRIRDLGFSFSLASFGEGKANWKSDLRSGVSPASLPPVPSAEEVTRLEQELRNTQTALDSAKRELDEQRQRNDRLKAAKTLTETREADLPTDEYDRFEALLTAAQSAVAKLGGFAGANDVVVDAVWHSVAGQQMYLPSHFEDPDRHDSINAEVKNGRLIFDDDNGEISPNTDFSAVARTRDAVAELTDYLDPALRSETFLEWFSQKYGTPMDLTMKACWNVVV